MARAQEPPPARLVVSYIYSSVDALADSLTRLERHFGPVQYETVDIPCTPTQDYVEEMGNYLQRRFFSFERLVRRDALPTIKKMCARVESQFADHVEDHIFRTVNIDPGLMTPDNLVMAHHREFNHRIYLSDGVFAETALIYARDYFTRLPWTNPDFCHDEAIDFFLRVRNSFDLVEEISPGLI